MSMRDLFKSFSHWGMYKVEEERDPQDLEVVVPNTTLAARIAAAAPAPSDPFGSQRYLLMKVLRYAKHPELGLVAVLSEAESSPYATVVTADYKVGTVCFWSLTPEVSPPTAHLKDPA